MKTKLYTLTTLVIMTLFLNSYNLKAQCTFNPTITGNTLLCNENDVLTLSTQSYDAYQWYRREWYWDTNNNPNPWVPVTGATNQSITINTTGNDFLFEFKVTATLGGCTEDSPVVLIDGYVYGLPFMVVNFEPNTFQQIADYEFNVCQGSTVTFENGYTAYGYHTWFKCLPSAIPPISSDPCILLGENGLTITATTNGTYGFYACTTYCPNQCEFLGQPYFVKLNFGNFTFCSLGTSDQQNNPINISVYPNPTAQFITIGKISNSNIGDFYIVDSNGKLIKQMNNFILETPIDVSDFATGTYFLQLKTDNKIFRNKFIKK